MCDHGRAVPGLDVRSMVSQPRDAHGDRCGAGAAGSVAAAETLATVKRKVATGAAAAVEYPFLHMLDHPATFPVALRALGNPNVSLLTSHLICSPPVAPDAGRNIGWHTDGGSPQFSVDGVRAFQQLKIGYFLVDLMEDGMGSLLVVPGSHKQAAIGHRSADDAADPPGAIQLKVHLAATARTRALRARCAIRMYTHAMQIPIPCQLLCSSTPITPVQLGKNKTRPDLPRCYHVAGAGG